MLELAARGFTVLHINLCGRNPPTPTDTGSDNLAQPDDRARVCV